MRIRLAVRTADLESDVVVDAPAGVSLAELRPVLAGAVGVAADVLWWSGDRQLGDSARLGGPGLRRGDRVSSTGPDVTAVFDPAAPHLAVVSGPGAGTIRPLDRGVHLLGRAPDCDLPLPDPEVSRRHAEVTVTTVGVTVRDLDSRNGTTCDGVAVDRDGEVLEPGARLRLGSSTVVLREETATVLSTRGGDDGQVLVLQPTEDRTAADPPTLTEPTPPADRGRPRIAWVAAFAPALAAVGLAWFLHTWLFLAFAALTPVTVLATATGDRWSWRADRRRAARGHLGAAAAFDRRRDDAVEQEAHERARRHPDAAAWTSAARGPAVPLWERRPGEADRWHVRVGTAVRPTRARTVRADGSTEPLGAVHAPVCADLARGALGITGRPDAVTAVARWVVGQLACAHPPGALEFVVLAARPDDPLWDWVRWLPHRVHRVADPGARAEVLAGLAARCTVATRPGAGARTTGPHTVVVVDGDGAVDEHADLDVVLRSGAAAGVHAVCVARSGAALPAACAAVAFVVGATHTGLALTGQGWDTSDGRPDVLGEVVADQVGGAWCEGLALALAALDDGSGGSDAGLPRTVRLADLAGPTDPDAVAQAWAAPTEATTPLRVVVGVGARGPVELDLTADGPHALVAGTTGSGKSELLQTWLAALATAHPPDDLAFLLVDYKGGAAFGACARLPHTVGLVTDLDRHLTGRVLRSLDAEIRRREHVFAAVGAADLGAYRQAHGGERVPRLAIVVDEFATLAADLPDFVPGLVDVAQRGRSLGLHLVLATQRPGGVVSPAIRANTTLRVALRVTDPAESLDVVGVPDAAVLDPTCPGRAVVRTGRDLVVVQAARVTSPLSVVVPTVRATRVGPWDDPPPPPAAHGSRTDLDDVAEALDKAWARRSGDGTPAPTATWLPPLPSTLTASDVAGEASVLSPVLGRRDQPGRQRQVAEHLDLAAGGTLLVAGASRTGRTGLLFTVAHAAAVAGVPTVVVDGGGLAALAGAGSTVAYAGADDPDALVRLVDLLERELAARRAGSEPAAPLVVLVDGWPALARVLDETDGGRSAERMTAVWRGAGGAGVTVVVTGDRSVLGSRTASAADRVWLLRLADPADAAMVGLAPRDVPDLMPPGRVVCVPDGDTVQLVLPAAPHPPVRPRPTVTGLRLRPLPDRVVLPPAAPGGTVLRIGRGGDEAGVVGVDPWAGGGRWVVAGPPRSGRSTALVRLGTEAADTVGATVVWWASPHSPLTTVADARGWTALDPDAAVVAVDGHERTLVLLDDADDLTDTPVSDALTTALRTAAPGRIAVVAAGRPDELLTAYRGVVAEVRRARRGLLLRPGPGDGDLVGIRSGRSRAGWPPGRGVLVAGGVRVDDRPVDTGPVTVQVALPTFGREDGGL
ncbi:FtsK/SpoIIIE domain-containing protein [Jatrophihabitans sp. YIM 134969]